MDHGRFLVCEALSSPRYFNIFSKFPGPSIRALISLGGVPICHHTSRTSIALLSYFYRTSLKGLKDCSSTDLYQFEHRHFDIATPGLESDRDQRAYDDGVRVTFHKTTHHAGALLQVDKHQHVGCLIGSGDTAPYNSKTLYPTATTHL